MRVLTYIYNSETADEPVERVLDRLEDRDAPIDYNDISAAADRDAALREALLTVGQAVRIGGKPSGVFDEEGDPDFSPGVMITEATTGRRGLHIGMEALEALQPDGEESGEDT